MISEYLTIAKKVRSFLMKVMVMEMDEGVKENAASTPKSRVTNQSRALMSMRLLQLLLLFLVLTLGISVVSIHMIKFLKIQHLDPVAPTTLISMYDHGTVTLDSFIRPPSNVWHTMNDSELLWRASMEPQRNGYPFKRVPKLACMFLSKGPLPFAPLWEKFFKGHEGLYSIYVHSLPNYKSDFSRSSVFYRRYIPSQVLSFMFQRNPATFFCVFVSCVPHNISFLFVIGCGMGRDEYG